MVRDCETAQSPLTTESRISDVMPWTINGTLGFLGLWIPQDAGIVRRLWHNVAFWGLGLFATAFLTAACSVSLGQGILGGLAYFACFACMCRARNYFSSRLVAHGTLGQILMDDHLFSEVGTLSIYLTTMCLVTLAGTVVAVAAFGVALRNGYAGEALRWTYADDRDIVSKTLASVTLCCTFWVVHGFAMAVAAGLGSAHFISQLIAKYRVAVGHAVDKIPANPFPGDVHVSKLEDLIGEYRRWHNTLQENCRLWSPVLTLCLITLSLLILVFAFALVQDSHADKFASTNGWELLVLLTVFVAALCAVVFVPTLATSQHRQVAVEVASARMTLQTIPDCVSLCDGFVTWVSLVPGWTVFGTELSLNVAKGIIVAEATAAFYITRLHFIQ